MSTVDAQDVTMSYSRKKAEQIVTGLERPLNLHLIKLIGVAANEETRRVWKREVLRWLVQIAALRLKPHRRLLRRADLFNWLYAEPFEGAEIENVQGILRYELDEFEPAATVETISARLAELQGEIAESLARGETPESLIDAL